MGLELSTQLVKFDGVSSGFAICSSTGNLRMNAKGETLGDGMICFYPRQDSMRAQRSVDYMTSEA